MILPGTDAGTALEIAERCRRALSTDTFRLHNGVSVTVTGCFGVACLPGDTRDLDTLIRRADRAMYGAKDAGRDRVHTQAGAPLAADRR